jgi:hypothetical protein
MKRMVCVSAILVAIAFSTFAQDLTNNTQSQKLNAMTSRPEIEKLYGSLPLSFERNEGQAGPQALFVSRSPHVNVLLSAEGLTVNLSHHDLSGSKGLPNRAGTPRQKDGNIVQAFRLNFVGSNNAPSVTGLDELPGKSNYLRGTDPQKWLRNIPTYARAKLGEVYPGVDVIYYGNGGQLEYDLSLAPNTDPHVIRFRVDGAESASVATNGDILLKSGSETMRLKKPVAYQQANGVRHLVQSRYVVGRDGEIHFAMGPYDRRRTLIIDPVLNYSTYLGGSFDDGVLGLAIDNAGNAYVAGFTDSFDFPVTPGAFQTTCKANCTANGDAFVTKLNPAGNAVVYSTFLGGSSSEEAMGIAVDSAGNAYVTGETFSDDFPLTPSAFQSTRGGDFDIFVSKLDPTGSTLLYSTYLGGTAEDVGASIAVDNSGNAFVGGYSFAPLLPNNFPTTPGAFQTSTTSFATGIVARIDTNASGAASLVYSTYLGGSFNTEVFDIALDSGDNAYVTGPTESLDFPVTAGAFQTQCKPVSACADAFVTKLNPQGSQLVYSTYLGGSTTDDGNGIGVDAAGYAYVVGDTNSTDFPVKNAYQKVNHGGTNGFDAFLTKINQAGSDLVYSTYLGGRDDDHAFGVAVDPYGNAWVTGFTDSINFPLANAIQKKYAGSTDVFVARFNEAGNRLLFSTYLGGSNNDLGLRIRADSTFHAYVAGRTFSVDFPVTPGAFQTSDTSGSGFVAKICVFFCP